MAVWNNTTKTEKGIALEQKLLTLSKPLKLVAAKSGTGTVNPTQLAKQTALVQPEQELELRPVYLSEENTATVPVMLSNAGLTKGYDLKQVGIYAEDPDDGEILYIIAQTDIAGGERVPSAAESPGYSIDWNFALKTSLASSIEVVVNEAGKLTLAQADARYANKEAVNVIVQELTGAIESVMQIAEAKVSRPGRLTGTLYANQWNASAKTYSFEEDYPAEEYDIEIEYAKTATEAQVEAFGAAKLAGDISTNVITAIGTVPPIDIPIYITVYSKEESTSSEGLALLSFGDIDTGYYAEIDGIDNNVENIVDADEKLNDENYSLKIL